MESSLHRGVRVVAARDLSGTAASRHRAGARRTKRSVLLGLPLMLAAIALVTPAALASASGPQLVVTPSPLQRDARAVVSAVGFAPGETGRIALNGNTAGMPAYRADSTGRFRVACTERPERSGRSGSAYTLPP